MKAYLILEFDDDFCDGLSQVKRVTIHENKGNICDYVITYFDSYELDEDSTSIICYYNNVMYVGRIYIRYDYTTRI